MPTKGALAKRIEKEPEIRAQMEQPTIPIGQSVPACGKAAWRRRRRVARNVQRPTGIDPCRTRRVAEIHGGALEIQNGLTHYPQTRETYLVFSRRHRPARTNYPLGWQRQHFL